VPKPATGERVESERPSASGTIREMSSVWSGPGPTGDVTEIDRPMASGTMREMCCVGSGPGPTGDCVDKDRFMASGTMREMSCVGSGPGPTGDFVERDRFIASGMIREMSSVASGPTAFHPGHGVGGATMRGEGTCRDGSGKLAPLGKVGIACVCGGLVIDGGSVKDSLDPSGADNVALRVPPRVSDASGPRRESPGGRPGFAGSCAGRVLLLANE